MRNMRPFLIITILMVFLIDMNLFASKDILVHFNFFEGIRQKENTSPTVASSYFLKPLEKNYFILSSHQTEQKTRLKRVYNLKEVKPLLQAQWIWQQGAAAEKFRTIVLNGHVFRVQLILAVKKHEDGFRLQVTERKKEKSKKILDTEITLPQENTAIFGFEDSMGKIYFLSFYREKNPGKADDETIDVSHHRVPELIKRIDPVYPPEAIQKNIEGTVIMEVVVDTGGNVSSVRVTGGKQKIFNDAAVKAVRQWKYQPYLVRGKAKPVKFIVVLDFYFY